MTYKTGSIGEFMQWTKRVVTDKAPDDDTPKHWFDGDATAKQALGTTTSPEAMVKLLSGENLALLRLILQNNPASLRELALLAHRKESNLSRTLRKLHDAGIVGYEEGPGRARAPRVTARRVTLDLDLVGPGSVVYVERPSVDVPHIR
jgi:predicted transcriptional regulator